MDQKGQVRKMSALQKAYICPYRNGRPVYGEKYTVQFNPAELSVEEAIGVSDNSGDTLRDRMRKLLEGSKVGWQHPMEATGARETKSSLTLSVTLFFNTLDNLYQSSYEDVREKIKPLYIYTNKNAEDKNTIEQIYFFWGSIGVAGTLNRMHVSYTVFAPDGRPVRAQVELSVVGDYYGDDTDGVKLSAGTDRQENKSCAQWRQWWKGTGNPRL